MGCSWELRAALKGGDCVLRVILALDPSSGWWHRLCSQGTVGKNEQEVVGWGESKPYGSARWLPFAFYAALSTLSLQLNLFLPECSPDRLTECEMLWQSLRDLSAWHELTPILSTEKQDIPLKQNQTNQLRGDSVIWTGFIISRTSHVTSKLQLFLHLMQSEPLNENQPRMFSRKSIGSPLLEPCESHQHRGSPRMHH